MKESERMEKTLQAKQEIDTLLASTEGTRYQKIYSKLKELPEVLFAWDEELLAVKMVSDSWFSYHCFEEAYGYGSRETVDQLWELCRRVRWILYHFEQNFPQEKLVEDLAYLEGQQVDDILLCELAKRYTRCPAEEICKIAVLYQAEQKIKEAVQLLLLANDTLGYCRELLIPLASIYMEYDNREQALLTLQKIPDPNQEEQKLIDTLQI